MATGDVALEVTNVAFNSAKETNPQFGTDSAERRQELTGYGLAQPGVNNGYFAQTKVAVEKQVGSYLSYPELYSVLDPAKRYTVKIIEQ